MAQTGFEEFERQATVTHEATLQLAARFLTLAHAMLQPPPTDSLVSLLRSLCLSIANSYQSVLLLTMNGCGSDALKIARSMFESAIVVGYLSLNPDLLQDFLDWRWVRRYKHQEFMAQYAPERFRSLDPAEVSKTTVEYAKIRDHFSHRHSWSNKDRRMMAKDVGLEQEYLALYPFTSSVHHIDVIGVMAQEDERINDIEVLPSDANIRLALAISGMSAYVALLWFDQAAGSMKAEELKNWFACYSAAQEEQVPKPAVAVQ
jgi:hypothetical protein